MSTRTTSSDKKVGISVTVFVVTIVILVIVAIFAGFCFFRLNTCIGEQMNNVCPTMNTNTDT